MTELLHFASEHPFLTWCLAWGIWPICWTLTTVLVAPFKYAFLAYNRRMRSLSIRAHGWPTRPQMDADGDIVHLPETERPWPA